MPKCKEIALIYLKNSAFYKKMYIFRPVLNLTYIYDKTSTLQG
jgi:hypothetical protein